MTSNIFFSLPSCIEFLYVLSVLIEFCCVLFVYFIFILVIVIFGVLVFTFCSDVFLLRFVILVIPRYVSVLLVLVIIVGTA